MPAKNLFKIKLRHGNEVLQREQTERYESQKNERTRLITFSGALAT
jgi:hypothetical protein